MLAMAIPDNFAFTIPTRIVFGVGAAEGIGEEMKNLGGRNCLVVAETGVLGAGIVDPVVRSLETAGLKTSVFSDFSPNPKDFEVLKGLEFAKSKEIDCIAGVGGGSSMDMAKAVGALMTGGGHPLDYAGVDLLKADLPPLIAVPTTSGTGSEVTFFAVVTDTKEMVKANLIDLRLAPKVALCDPALTRTLPASFTAATGMDALCHAVEAFTSVPANPFSEAMALRAIETISTTLRDAVKNGGDLAARAKMMAASTLAGIAFSTADCCGVHCLGESYGGRYDMPHGVACTIFLPTVLEYNAEATPARHARVAQAMGVNIDRLSAGEAARRGIEAIKQLSADIGIPKFREMPGVKPEEFPLVAKGAKGNVCDGSQPRETSEDDYLMLLNRAYAG